MLRAPGSFPPIHSACAAEGWRLWRSVGPRICIASPGPGSDDTHFGRLYDTSKQRWCEHSTRPFPQSAYQIATFSPFTTRQGSDESVFLNTSHRAISPSCLVWSPLTTRQGCGESICLTTPTGRSSSLHSRLEVCRNLAFLSPALQWSGGRIPSTSGWLINRDGRNYRPWCDLMLLTLDELRLCRPLIPVWIRRLQWKSLLLFWSDSDSDGASSAEGVGSVPSMSQLFGASLRNPSWTR